MPVPFLKSTFLLILAAISCNSNKEEETGTVLADSATVEETPVVINTDLYIWELDPSSMTRKKNPVAAEGSIPVDSLITGLNRKFPEIRMEKVKQSGDTLVARIPDASFLTQQFGSTGAEYYVAEAVLNLTTVPGINFVKLEFKPGDHAEPGVFSKKSFEKYKAVY